MACCGGGMRSPMPGPMTRPDSPARRITEHTELPTVMMEYTGGKSLSAVGPVTGNRYRFDRPGARMGVDVRDRAALATIAVLKVV